MSARTTSATGTRTRVRPHAAAARPPLVGRHGLHPAAGRGGAERRSARRSPGRRYLVVGLLGTVIAIVVTHLTRAAGWPLISAGRHLPRPLLPARRTAVPALAGRHLPSCPVAGTLARVADQAVFGWKDLLTTLPPVDGDGPLLVLPWLAGMVAGLVGSALAHLPVRRAWLAALLPVARDDRGPLRGDPARRPPPPVAARAGRGLHRARPRLAGDPGPPGECRRARRQHVVRPRCGSRRHARRRGAPRPSRERPLRRRRLGARGGPQLGRAALRHRPLPLAARRLPQVRRPQGRGQPGQRLRQDAARRRRRARRDPGAVRGHGPLRRDGVGRHRRRAARPGRRLLPARVVHHRQPGRGEGGRRDRHPRRGVDGVWLPTVGALRSMDFQTGDARAKAEVFRYNLATSTAVVPTGLQRGDRYSFTAVQPDDELGEETVGSGRPDAPAGGCGVHPGSDREVDRGRRHRPDGPRAAPPPSTCARRASTPTASAAPSTSTSPATARGGCPTSSSTRRRSWATTSSTPRRWR